MSFQVEANTDQMVAAVLSGSKTAQKNFARAFSQACDDDVSVAFCEHATEMQEMLECLCEFVSDASPDDVVYHGGRSTLKLAMELLVKHGKCEWTRNRDGIIWPKE